MRVAAWLMVFATSCDGACGEWEREESELREMHSDK